MNTKYNKIQLILDKKGKTQAWLAEKIGKSLPSVNKYCNNTTQPTIKMLYVIATALDVDVKSLLVDNK